MWLFESISSFGDFIFNQHLAGLINLMVNKSSGLVIEREIFFNDLTEWFGVSV